MTFILNKLFKNLIALFIILILGCGGKKPSKPLTIYAAASLSSILPVVGKLFSQKYATVSLEYNFAASSVLARQIEYGARADIFVSANPKWVNYLEKKGLIAEGTRKEFLGNRLVLITPKSKPLDIHNMKELISLPADKIALADWNHVPAGIYSKIALEKMHLWEKLQTRFIAAADVRAALTYVERGDVPLAIVYRTDAAISQKVKVLFELPFQPEIRYMAALIKNSRHPASQFFLNFLTSSEAGSLFKKAGFETIPDSLPNE
ncbi:MAG: molybdate ABC transporter substrate-binding protein [Calditrichaeota bacterium]|nr:MAG: molybdate ABC transporter substrate-binding protein [Calditrichota bacterium]